MSSRTVSLDGLAASLSLTLDEKLKVFEELATLSREAVQKLARIFTEEQSKFAALARGGQNHGRGMQIARNMAGWPRALQRTGANLPDIAHRSVCLKPVASVPAWVLPLGHALDEELERKIRTQAFKTLLDCADVPPGAVHKDSYRPLTALSPEPQTCLWCLVECAAGAEAPESRDASRLDYKFGVRALQRGWVGYHRRNTRGRR